MKSTEFLQAAIDTQAERGKQYDSPGGERSMGRTVQAFNAITGRDLTEAEGWLLLQVLKDVRQWQNPDKYHHDSALDGVAYASLKAEALCNAPRPIDPNAQEVKPFPFTLPTKEPRKPHYGGPCPVSHEEVEVVLRSGEVRRGMPEGFVWGWSAPDRLHSSNDVLQWARVD